jgi:hypothetical protein
MAKKGKIIKGKIIELGAQNICLYCGQQMKGQYEEYTQYFECNCIDAQKEREIREQIRKLELQLPRPKFEIREESVLCKIK